MEFLLVGDRNNRRAPQARSRRWIEKEKAMRVEYSSEVQTVRGKVMPKSGLVAVECLFCKGVHFHTGADKPVRSFCADEKQRGLYRISELTTATAAEAFALRRRARQKAVA
jgi:hypothetical protein